MLSTILSREDMPTRRDLVTYFDFKVPKGYPITYGVNGTAVLVYFTVLPNNALCTSARKKRSTGNSTIAAFDQQTLHSLLNDSDTRALILEVGTRDIIYMELPTEKCITRIILPQSHSVYFAFIYRFLFELRCTI